jgi:glutaredoxin-like protein
MLAYLAPGAGKPLDVTVMSRDGCPFCIAAKESLRDAGIDFDELILNRDYTDQSLRAIAGSASVPQVFVNGNHIGGAQSLEAWLSAREAA